MATARAAGSVGVCALFLLAAGVGIAGGGLVGRAEMPGGDATVTLRIGGIARQYLVHPSTAPSPGRVPAVLVFHRGDGDAGEMVTMSGFNQAADRNGFVAVYPQGYQGGWNDGRGAVTQAGALGIDDIGFVSAVIDQLVAADNVDPGRVYATGISNGALLTENLGCRLSGKIAAIAPVAGPMPTTQDSDCAPSHRMPVLEIHGTADPFIPYGGGAGADSVEATQQLWRRDDSCGPAVTTTLPQLADDGTSVTTQTSTCADNTKVELYSIAGGGHTWPDGPQYLPESVVGPVSHQFNATDVIWQFFADFSR